MERPPLRSFRRGLCSGAEAAARPVRPQPNGRSAGGDPGPKPVRSHRRGTAVGYRGRAGDRLLGPARETGAAQPRGAEARVRRPGGPRACRRQGARPANGGDGRAAARPDPGESGPACPAGKTVRGAPTIVVVLAVRVGHRLRVAVPPHFDVERTYTPRSPECVEPAGRRRGNELSGCEPHPLPVVRTQTSALGLPRRR